MNTPENLSVGSSSTTLIPVSAQHRLDHGRLAGWMKEHVASLGEIQAVRQFQGGQSNPTYLVEGTLRTCVLRKQPPGILLPSAHAVHREFRVLGALAGTAVPVPRVFALCQDPTVLGASFYVMDYVLGRVFADPTLESCRSSERSSIYSNLARTLAALHAVDWRGVGLADFGLAEDYLARQLNRWSKQFALSGLVSRDMNQLAAWLGGHIPASDATGEVCSIAHGDYRLGNVIFAPDSAQVTAVIDWELATIGHPLADLAYSCLAWRLPATMNGLEGHVDLSLPGEKEYLSTYGAAAGGRSLDGFEFFVAFSLFRWAAILAGVYRRALNGNAADARGIDAGRRFEIIAKLGWRTACAA